MQKKKFFSSQKAHYEDSIEVCDNIIQAIFECADSTSKVVITRELVPKEFYSWKTFMRHGGELKLGRFETLEELLKAKKTPEEERREKFGQIKDSDRQYCSLSIKPVFGTDKRVRKYTLSQVIEGAKIYAYSGIMTYSGDHVLRIPAHLEDNIGVPSYIEIKPYDGSAGIEKSGVEIAIKIPSRRKNQPKYDFKVISVPIANEERKIAIAKNITTTHKCKGKMFDIRYKTGKESSLAINFDAHDIAAYFAICDYYYNVHQNRVPYDMSQFPMPTQFMVSFYNSLRHVRMKIKDREERPLNPAEKNMILIDAVRTFGYDTTLSPKKGEKIKNYDWFTPL